MLNPKTLLLVNDNEAEVLEADRTCKQGMSSNHNVDLAGAQTFANALPLGRASETR